MSNRTLSPKRMSSKVALKSRAVHGGDRVKFCHSGSALQNCSWLPEDHGSAATLREVDAWCMSFTFFLTKLAFLLTLPSLQTFFFDLPFISLRNIGQRRVNPSPLRHHQSLHLTALRTPCLQFLSSSLMFPQTFEGIDYMQLDIFSSILPNSHMDSQFSPTSHDCFCVSSLVGFVKTDLSKCTGMIDQWCCVTSAQNFPGTIFSKIMMKSIFSKKNTVKRIILVCSIL